MYPSPADEQGTKDVKTGLFIGLCFVLFVLLMAYVQAITIGCGEEVEVNTACVIRTPPITCSTYDIFNATNNVSINDGTMEEVILGSGVYNFTFNANGTGIHSIVLCDNTSTQLLVQNTDKTDLTTILSNQATLQDNIETVNQTVKDRTKLINDSIIANLSNDLGFFNPLLQIFNLSIIDHIRNNITAAVTDIVSRGDSAWITATGFQTETNALTRYGNLLLNFSDVLNNLTALPINITTEHDAIIANLSNDNGFFGPLFLTLNTSIIANLTQPVTVSISTADEESLAVAFARKVLGANLTTYYNYNFSSFTLTNVLYNYSNLGILPNESYTYNNESFLNVTDRVTK